MNEWQLNFNITLKLTKFPVVWTETTQNWKTLGLYGLWKYFIIKVEYKKPDKLHFQNSWYNLLPTIAEVDHNKDLKNLQ